MSEEFTRDLRHLMARRQVIAVVGCGVSIGATRGSALANLASWAGLLKDGVRQCVGLRRATEAWATVVLSEIKYGLDTPGETDSLLSAAEKISRKLGAPDGGEFSRWLRTTVGTLDVLDDRVIKALHALNIPLATTNYDNLLEDVTGLRPVTWKDGRRVERLLRGEEAGILHLHGHWERPETVILGSHSYEEILRDEHAQAMQKAMSCMNSLLFVGFGDGLEDSNIGGLLRWYGSVFSSSEYRHYRLAIEGQVDQFQQQHLPSQRVQVISYGAKHSDLAPFLERLASGGPSRSTGGGSRPAIISIHRDELFPELDEDLKQAHALLKEYRYEEALASLRDVLARLDRTAQVNERDLELEKRLSRCRFMLGGALLCLQMPEEAREIWRQVNPHDISEMARIELARGRAQLGDIKGAEELLPQGSAGDDVEDTRKLIAICKGQLPETPPKEQFIRISACYLLVEEGRLEDAVQWALEEIDVSDPAMDPLCGGNAAGVLFAALQRTILEQPPLHQPIPVSLREAVVQAINALLDNLIDETRHVPQPMRISALKLAAGFHAFARDWHRQRQAHEALARLGVASPEPEAPALAASGKLDEALHSLHLESHPWVGRLKRATLLAIAGKYDDAGSEFLALAEEFPGRAPIEYHCAETLLQRQNAKESLRHAQVAYTQLPTLGCRLMLVQALLLNEQPEQAWLLLQPVRSSDDPTILRALAFSAEHVHRPGQESLDLTHRYLSIVPTDATMRIAYAVQLRRLGDPLHAREEAWQAVSSAGSESLDMHRLHAAAGLQLTAEKPDNVARERIQQIARLLKEKFPKDPNAEVIRLQLLAGLGFPNQENIDYTLMEQAGLLWAATEDEVFDRWRKQHEGRQEMAKAVLRLYQTGIFSLESLCLLTGVHPPLYLSRVIHLRDHEVFLCTPPSRRLLTPQMPPGSDLLTGEMELLLLHHLGLLEQLRGALGQQGRIYVFQDVEISIRQETIPPLWQQQNLRDRLRAKDELWEQIFLEDKIIVEKSQPTVRDVDTAVARGHGVVSRQRPVGAAAYIAPSSLVDWLASSGAIPAEAAGRLTRALPAQDVQITGLPSVIHVELSLLELLHQERVLPLLLQILPGQLWIGPETVTVLRNERENLRTSLEASERSAAITAFLSAGMREGWLLPLDRKEPSLPPLIDQKMEPVAESLGRALAYRLALEANPKCYLLTSDFLVTAPFTPSAPPSLMSLFRWTPESYERLKHRLDSISDRIVHLPEFLTKLGLPEPRLHQARRDLAELGFVDALDSEDIRQLARSYQGLRGEVPRRLLDRAEWMAREREHPGSLPARHQIARLYAASIWAVWAGPNSTGERELLTLGVLERAEALDELSPGTLDDIYADLGALATNAPHYSFVEEGGSNEWWRPAPESQAGQLWTYLTQWAGEGRRRASFLRSIQRVLCTLHEIWEEDGPQPEQLAPLFIALQAAEPESAGESETGGIKVHLSFSDMTFGVLAALSAKWKFQPLAGAEVALIQQPSGKAIRIVLQDVIDYGVQLLERDEIRGSAHSFLFRFPFGTGGESVVVEVIPEALVLRASREAIVRNAPRLAGWYMAQDGTLAQLWHRLGSMPDEIPLRREIARRAVLAPFRLVRADASIMCHWLLAASPPALHHLRQMLHVPANLSEGPIWEVLRRTQDRTGSALVMRQVSEIPGPVPGYMVQARLREPGYAVEVAEALLHLEEGENQPAGRLCGDILFLRLAAVSKPIVGLDRGEIDLRTEVPERLTRLLRLTMDQPSPDTLAATEAGLLRLCAAIVEVKALPNQLSIRDGLWLTYRLYQWLSSQLAVLSSDARRGALLMLQRNAPQANPEERCGPDILNPFRFARDRFDHRLATVLYSLRLMEDYGLRSAVLDAEKSTERLAEEASAHDELRSISSPGLEALLVELAGRGPLEPEARHRSSEPSALGWDAPTSVSELALAALLALNGEAFLRLPEAVRMGWLLQLPESQEQSARLHPDTIQLLIGVAAEYAKKLSPTERVALLDRVRSLPEGIPADYRLRHTWLALIGLYGSGHADLESEIRELFTKNLRHELAPLAFANYLVALSFVDPLRIEEETFLMLAMLRANKVPAFPFISGLGRVIFMGSPVGTTHAQALLRRLAQDPLWVNDVDLRRLMKLLNL